jgi:hypothetical protein
MIFSTDTKAYVNELFAETAAHEAAYAEAGNVIMVPSLEVEFPIGEFPYDDAAFERRYPPSYDVESF